MKEWNSGILSQILKHHSLRKLKTCIDKSVSWFQSKALHFCTSSHVEAHGLTWHWHHIWRCMKHPKVAVHLRQEPFPSLDFVGFGAWQECYISMSLHPTGKCRKWTSTQSSCSPSIGNLGFWRGLWEDLKTWNKAALVIACFRLFCCVSCCFTFLLQQREEDVSIWCFKFKHILQVLWRCKDACEPSAASSPPEGLSGWPPKVVATWLRCDLE